jgi:putative DNA primase/helicase
MMHLNGRPDKAATAEPGHGRRGAPPSPAAPAYEAVLDPGSTLWKLNQFASARLAVIPVRPVYHDWPEPGEVRCECGRDDCAAVGKHPRVSWKDITSPPDYGQLAWWYYSTHPAPFMANWAILLGACDPALCALDFDPRNNGDKTMAELLACHGPLPRTWSDRSSRGGGHFYFRRPDGLPDKSCIALGEGVELLQGRHIVVIDPSTHKSGVRYRWLDAPWDAPLAELPPWLADAARTKAGPKASAGHGAAAPAVYYPPADLSSTDIIGRARKYIDLMPPSVQGQRGSDALMAVCGKLAQGFGLDYHEAWPLVCEYNQRARPPWSDRELRHKLEDALARPAPNGKPRGYLLEQEGPRRRRGWVDTRGLPDMSLDEIKRWVDELEPQADRPADTGGPPAG